MRIRYSTNVLFFFLLYLSLLIGFLFNENLNFGSYHDWVRAYVPPINDFSKNFKETILSYEKYGQRHSPIYLIFLSTFIDLGLNLNFVRIIHLHLSLSLIFIFYNCLKLNFPYVEKKYLQLLSFVIFLSPTFRSLSIWPDSRLPGLIFFVLAVYFFLKFLKNNNSKNTWLCSVSLIISSYISPNFSLFSLYFYFFFVKKLSLVNLVLLFIFNLILAIPAFYYLFVLKINFLVAGRTPGIEAASVAMGFNFSDKIMIISSILFFHLIPIFASKNFYYCFVIFFKRNVLMIIVAIIILTYFFNYQVAFTGGGFFFQLSHLLFKNNYLFFGVCLISVTFLFYCIKKNINNLYLIILLVLSNVQNSIYHKYYEPLVLIMFFTLFKNMNVEYFFKSKINLIYLYLFSLVYIFLRILKNQLHT